MEKTLVTIMANIKNDMVRKRMAIIATSHLVMFDLIDFGDEYFNAEISYHNRDDYDKFAFDVSKYYHIVEHKDEEDD